MRYMPSTWITVLVLVLLAHQINISFACIGVCYGLNGDNLPSPKDVIELYKRSQIQRIRIFEPLPEVLEALRGSNLLVTLGMRNEDITNIAASQEAANDWVNTHLVPYKIDVAFRYVTVGNEVIPGPLANYVTKAMNNTWNAIVSNGLDRVRVTTVVPANALGVSYPPSAGAFSDEVLGAMTDVATILYYTHAPLMINVYPYFAYASNPEEIPLDYALLNSNLQTVTVDGELNYNNLFDAMVDAFNTALEKINMGDVYVFISETGWPSAGNEPYTSIENARVYNTNVKKHIHDQVGTPRRPGRMLDTFFFAMFNENLKPAGVEQNFGLFYPDMSPVYPLD
ncbi:hypothetical protein AQUCO_05200037v1 [Aquilegia coerulea]|uniref:Glucan endo-1,3-beta-D-glucosidase n=1 Tax=Aquilegia coerulea TaxID=218851 RepID=A0A2G5CIS0_AQUCA|nr:hypothetical protein AQUCO_05200037v1 [Aquilegia coerulea]